MFSPSSTPTAVDCAALLDTDGPHALVDAVTPWLNCPADEVDRELAGDRLRPLARATAQLNASARYLDERLDQAALAACSER